MSDETGTLEDGVGILRDLRDHVHIEWEIVKYSESQKKEYLISPRFLLSDNTWYLKLLPNGDIERETDGWISLYLMKESCQTKCTHEKHNIDFTLGIKKSNGLVHSSWGTENPFILFDGYGCPKLMKRSELQKLKNDFLLKDTLKLFCVARLVKTTSVETDQTVPPEGSVTLIDNLTELYQNGRFSDLTIRVEEKEFQAHRLILAARSPVFASMFEHDTAEKNSGVVDITDCNSNSFGDFLLYLYTGKLDKVSTDNVFDLYKVADKYDLQELRVNCAQYMACNLSVDSFCDAILIALMHDEPELLKSATEFFIENAKDILPTTMWQTFMKHHLTFANELLIKMVNKS